MSGVSDYAITTTAIGSYHDGNLLVEPLNTRVTGIQLHLSEDRIDLSHNTVNEVRPLHVWTNVPK